MNIAVSALGNEIDSLVSRDFRDSPWFVIFDRERQVVDESVHNPSAEIPEGGTEEAARLLVDRNVEVLISENIGSEAGDILASQGIKMYSIKLDSDTVEKTIQRFEADELAFHRGPTTGVYREQGSPTTAAPYERKPGKGMGEGQDTSIHPVRQEEYVCPECGANKELKTGEPKNDVPCPECGAQMIRRSQRDKLSE